MGNRTEQRKKYRYFRLQEELISNYSTLIYFDGIYPEYKFAKTKLNDVYYIFATIDVRVMTFDQTKISEE